jgi:hypothetical protein
VAAEQRLADRFWSRAARVYDWLRIAFGRDRVFRDVQSIGIGKWKDKIGESLEQCSVCVVMVGPRWADDENLPRLHDEEDSVRYELVTVLSRRDVTIVPLLVAGLTLERIPRDRLPVELQALFSWNAFPISEEAWESDIRRLIAAIAASSKLQMGSDVDLLMGEVASAHLRVVQLEREKRLQAIRTSALRRTIDDLQRRVADVGVSRRRARAGAPSEHASGRARRR